MQKILLFTVLLMFSSLAKSQDTIKATFISINKYATTIDNLLLQMNSSIKADRHTEIHQQLTDIKTALLSIETELQYLPDEYYNSFAPVVASFKTEADEFEKLTLKKSFLDKDKRIIAKKLSLEQIDEVLKLKLPKH